MTFFVRIDLHASSQVRLIKLTTITKTDNYKSDFCDAFRWFRKRLRSYHTVGDTTINKYNLKNDLKIFVFAAYKSFVGSSNRKYILDFKNNPFFPVNIPFIDFGDNNDFSRNKTYHLTIAGKEEMDSYLSPRVTACK